MIIQITSRKIWENDNDSQSTCVQCRIEHRHAERNPGEVGKFKSQEIAALKNNDDLVTQVQTRYALDRPQAQKDVDAFAKGRQL